MKHLGLKKLLILCLVLLVAFTVSLTSIVLYFQEKSTLTNSITNQSQTYVAGKANIIETLIHEKVMGVKNIARQYATTTITGDDAQMVDKTFFMANALNIDSATLAFENGDAFWNRTGKRYPNHKFIQDVTKESWYQQGRRASDVTVTEPYKGFDGNYWITIANRIKGGAITGDMTLGFLTQLVTSSTEDVAGVHSVILNKDTTVMASSDETLTVGKKANEADWFADIADKVVSKGSTAQRYTHLGQDYLLFSHKIKAGDKVWYFVTSIDAKTAFAPLNKLRNTAILVTLLSIIISMTVAIVLVQVLYRPILSLKKTINDLASGDADLTQRLDVQSHDDLGQISDSVNRFIGNLQIMMQEIRESTHTLQSNVAIMREQSQRNSDILQNHLSETEQVVTAIEEMNSTAEAMASDAANTARLTQQANDTSVESRAVVTQSQETVSALLADVDRSASEAQNMSEETQRISGILSVIGDIAEQTNLLALNAAIEAARAGEQGRGFAVVADEVRNLASRTKDSTGEIEAALNSLLAGNQRVVDAMDHTKNRCQDTAEGSKEVAHSLDKTNSFVDEINDLSSQIATAAEEQSSVTMELSRNMTSIRDIVNELDGNAKETLTETQAIAEVNDKLMAIVNRFKV